MSILADGGGRADGRACGGYVVGDVSGECERGDFSSCLPFASDVHRREAGLSSTLAMALEESNESSKSTMTVAYQDRDIAKAGFLRLLVRCRRIVLQDAAFHLHHKQKSLIQSL